MSEMTTTKDARGGGVGGGGAASQGRRRRRIRRRDAAAAAALGLSLNLLLRGEDLPSVPRNDGFDFEEVASEFEGRRLAASASASPPAAPAASGSGADGSQGHRGLSLVGGSSSPLPNRIFIPPSLDAERQRRLRELSLDLGGGNCKWEPPSYEVPETIEFHKTLVAGYPSGDKRMAYLQMEALSGWPAKDEWDFLGLGMSNHPFIKANYPHHEGVWGWDDAADQVVMMVPNLRRSLVEYHDILWDLGYATTWEDTLDKRDNLFLASPSLEDYYEWRDARVLEEVRWYGWFIDYWMEGGLMRDVFSHRLTTQEHWDDILHKPFYTRQELAYENYVANETLVAPTYDPHCSNLEISGGCAPVAVISAEKLLDYDEGPAETSTIATILGSDARTSQYVIASEAWDCIWSELIQEKKGPRNIVDRPGYAAIEGEYKFSAEMLEVMLDELDRLIGKYSGTEWTDKATAVRLVEILTGHRGAIAVELDEVNNGLRARRLATRDFLGPKERRERRKLRPRWHGEDPEQDAWEREERARYLSALEQKRHDDKLRDATERRRRANREKRGEARRRREHRERRLAGAPAEDEGLDEGRPASESAKVLEDALSHIAQLEAILGIDRETAAGMEERVRAVAAEAKVSLEDR